MEEIKVNVQKNLSIPASVNAITITHEWGGEIASDTGLTPLGTYSFTPNSIGIHKVQWLNNTTVVSTVFYSVYAPLVSGSQLFEEKPDLEDYEDFLPQAERFARHVIQNYTSQKFGPYVGKTMEIQGDGGDSLVLPVRITALTSIENNYGDDITELVEISPNDATILQRTARFRGSHYYEIKRDIFWNSYELFNERYNFSITGDWGWEYVPPEVTDAAILLIQDILVTDEVSEARAKGIFQLQLGDFAIRLNADQWGTTGNAMADNLLAAYLNFGIGLA